MAASDASGAPAMAAALAAPTCLNKASREASGGAFSSVGLAMDFLQSFAAYEIDPNFWEPRSEIRLVCGWHSDVLSREISIRVFGADYFRPLAKRPPIAYGR